MDKTNAFSGTPHRHRLALPSLLTLVDRTLKRLVDIIGAAVGLFFLSPFFLLVAIRIRRSDPGPVFHRCVRVGKDGRLFQIIKFRTMREDAESHDGAKVTAYDDPRVTPLGHWLRNTKLNELPQLWNVLRGEMSLVGPRPEDPEIVATWPEDARREILSMRPGITSPTSVLYRDEESLLSADKVMETYLGSIAPSKLRLDRLYVRHRSFMLDLDVIFWTVLALLPLLRAYDPPLEALYLGPLRRIVRRYLNWLVVDTIIAFTAILLTGVLWRLFQPLDLGPLKAVAIAIGFSFLFSITGTLFGIHRTVWSQASSRDVFVLFAASIVAGSAALGINEWLRDSSVLPSLAVVFASLLAFAGLVLVRYRSRLLSGLASHWLESRGNAQVARERILIVGSGYAGQLIAWLLCNGPNADAFHIVGFADDDLFKQGSRLSGLRVLGKRADIPRLVQKYDVGLLIYAINNITPAERECVLEICRSTPARVVIAPDIAGIANAEIQKGTVWVNRSYPDGSDSAMGAQERLFVHTVTPVKMQSSVKAETGGK